MRHAAGEIGGGLAEGSRKRSSPSQTEAHSGRTDDTKLHDMWLPKDTSRRRYFQMTDPDCLGVVMSRRNCRDVSGVWEDLYFKENQKEPFRMMLTGGTEKMDLFIPCVHREMAVVFLECGKTCVSRRTKGGFSAGCRSDGHRSCTCSFRVSIAR